MWGTCGAHWIFGGASSLGWTLCDIPSPTETCALEVHGVHVVGFGNRLRYGGGGRDNAVSARVPSKWLILGFLRYEGYSMVTKWLSASAIQHLGLVLSSFPSSFLAAPDFLSPGPPSSAPT